jgi:hypothetical protein
MTRRPLASSPRTRRGFALPLVVLLTLIASLSLVLLLERRAVAHRTVQRQVQTYSAHHRAAGIQETITQWLGTTRVRGRESLSDTGLAFRLVLPGGEEIRVGMEDGQGAALIDETNLTAERRTIVRRMREYLAQQPPELTDRATRAVGPAEISIRAAPAIVIDALVVAIVDPDRQERAVEAILSRRNAGLLTREELPRALTDVGVTDEERDLILSMLVESPSVWQIVAEIADSRGRRLSRSGGLMEWRPEARSDVSGHAGMFLTWEDLPVEDEAVGQPVQGVYSGSRSVP